MAVNKYEEMKKRHQEEINKFPFGFAFDLNQYEKMMQKWGLKHTDTDKICSIGGCGYVRKCDLTAMHEMFDRHKKEFLDAVAEDATGDGFIYDMFYYELCNHEYGYTSEYDDALETLGYTPEQVVADKRLYHGLVKASDAIL